MPQHAAPKSNFDTSDARGAYCGLSRQGLFLSLALPTALLALCLICMRPKYETNDDVAMQMISSAQLVSDAPDEHLMFTNVAVGLALSRLYAWMPTIPWYGAYLTGIQLCSFCALCAVFLWGSVTPKRIAMALVFLVVVGFQSSVLLQFTKVGFFAGLAGLLLFRQLGISSGAMKGTTRIGLGAAASALVVCSALVRFESLILACLTCLPFVVIDVVRARPATKQLIKASVAMGAVLLACCGLNQFNSWYYSQDDWRTFLEYNSLRSQFTDYATPDKVETISEHLDLVEWTVVDLQMLMGFNFADPQRYSADNMRTLLNESSKGVVENHRASTWRQTWQEFRVLFESRMPKAILLVGVFLLATMGGGWRSRTVPILCLLLTALVLGVLNYRLHHVPERVVFPAVTAFLAFAVLHSRPDFGPTISISRGLVGGCAAVGILFYTTSLVSDLTADNRSREIRAEHTRDFTRQLIAQPNRTIVIWGSAYPFEEVISPFYSIPEVSELKVIGLGCSFNTPLSRKRLRECKIDDLYAALVDRPDVLLVCSEQQAKLQERYLSLHYPSYSPPQLVYSHSADSGTRCWTFSSQQASLPTDRRR